MALRIKDITPDFTAQTTRGEISFHKWLGTSWGVLFSHPKDFTPVCTTELGALAGLEHEFAKRDVKVIGLSVDPVNDHERWLADNDLSVAKLYNMLPAKEAVGSAGRSAADYATVRTVFVIDPDKRIRLHFAYPMSTGRNFAELIRSIDSMQLTGAYKMATPADWQPGKDVIILPAVSDTEAKTLFPDGWETVMPYLRRVPDPN